MWFPDRCVEPKFEPFERSKVLKLATYIFLSWVCSKFPCKDIENSLTHPTSLSEGSERKVIGINFPQIWNERKMNHFRQNACIWFTYHSSLEDNFLGLNCTNVPFLKADGMWITIVRLKRYVVESVYYINFQKTYFCLNFFFSKIHLHSHIFFFQSLEIF